MMTYRIKRILNLLAVLCLLTGLGISSAQAALFDHFVTTWKTDNPGQSNNTSIIVPMKGGPYDVDWDNDGIFDEFWLTGPATHDFGVAGTYTIRIQGSYWSIAFENAGDKDKIVSLDQWGTQAWTSMHKAFQGCSNLEIPATDTPDFSAVLSMTSMFDGASAANPDTSGWDISSVRGMSLMFYGATSANPDTSGWDTSSVLQTRYMFYGATSANPDTSGWNMSSVTDMSYMFHGATSANPDTSGWDTSSVTDMSYMFHGATSANPDTSGWNTSSVTNMQSMFEGASAANPDTSGWDTLSVVDMGKIFYGATSANPDTSGWDTSSALVMFYMVADAPLANPDTSGWNTSLVTDMRYMFSGATSANPDTSGWDTSSVTHMRAMFYRASSANPDTSGWDTSSVVNMSYMFYRATSADPDTSGWDMSGVTDTSRMFYRVTLSRPNYEALLINWNAQALQPGLSFDGGYSAYCSDAAANARANMINSDGWSIADGGQDCAGQTPPPTAVTSSASSIGTTGARLNGTADPNGAATSAWFQWGTSSSYGNATSPQTNVGSGTSPVSYNFNLSALACGTTYHFRAVAQNAGGTAYGSDRSFTTSACPTPPPTVVTSPASNIGTTGARLNGTADPNGAGTSAWYQWGTSTAYGNVTAPQTNVGSGTSPVSYNFNLSALACGTTYHFRAVAQNSGGTSYGTDRSFTTAACPAPPPTVVTSPASSIGETVARLNGTADPNGAGTSAWFQWGTSTAYGNATAPASNVGSGTSPVSYAFDLGGLQCGTTYHFRAVAQNSGGTSYGTDRSFTTSACPTPPPTVVTSPANSIGETAARLNGTADPNGAGTSAWFQWGTTTAYGNTTSPQTNVGSGTSPVSYNFNLSALACGTTYHFRAVAQNAGGTAYGTDRSFTTAACPAPPPTVVTSPANSIGETAARLNGTADPNGAGTSAWFQWGTSTAYGNATAPASNVGSGTSPVSYAFDLGGLQCGTTYHFRAVAENSGGAAYGTDRSFTTSACPAPPPTVVTSPASSIGETVARLNGTADPNGASTSAWFQWGTSTAYGNVTSPQTNVGSGTSAVSYSFDLGGLQCGTTYHFRAVAENSGGAAYGTDRSFTTSACPAPPPTVVTSPASSIGETVARLNGTADPNGASTSAWFQWGTSTDYGNVTSPQTNVGSGTSAVSYSFDLGGLQCGATYHFRAVAQNSGGTAYGSDRSFTTSGCSTPPPTVVTSAASSIGTSWALLNGTADPNGASTSAWFQWGTSTAYGNATAPSDVGSGTSPVSYTTALGGLQCGTTYHFRAVAENSGGVAYGTDRSFTTSACSTPPPTVVTSAASSIGETAARLNGTADPNGADTSAWFEWGTSTAYGNVTAPGTSVGSGTSPVSYSFDLGELQCGTTYHFRAVAENSGGAAYGTDHSFTTTECPTPPPTVVTSPASGIGETAARLNGTADPNGAATSAWFEWGTNTGYGNATAPQTNVGSGTSPVSYSFDLGGLQCGTTYHFRAVAENGGGAAYGSDRSFTTSACSTPPPTVVTSPANSIGETAARLNGTADPNGADTSAWFEWGTSTAYGNVNAPSNVGSGTSPLSYSFDLGELQCGTTYHFRAVAENAGGTAYGSDRSFNTSACPGQEDVILESRFETGSKEGWSSKGKVSVDGVLAIDQYSLRHEKGGQSVYSVSTAGYEGISVTMHLAATSLRSVDACFAEVSTDGGDSWMPVVTLQDGEDKGTFYSGTVFPPGADDSLDVKLRFRASGKGNKGYCYGDEVYVMGTLIEG